MLWRRTWWIVLVAVAVVGVVVWQLLGGGRSGPEGIWTVQSAAPETAESPSESPSAPASSVPPTDCVTAMFDTLDLTGRVGQLVMVGTPVDNPRTLAAAVTKYHLGGVFLAGRSTRPAAALRVDLTALQHAAAGPPLLIALDQEGGQVQTLKGSDFPLMPSALVQGTWSRSQLASRTATQAGRLAAIGVNLNLAPVADTVPASIGTANPPIGAFRREFGSDPDAVAADIRTVVPASQDAGVLTTLKHFPGLGRVTANTDTSTQAVDTTATVNDPYLRPFAAGVRAGSAAVMVSSASYPKLDRTTIAAFSRPIITGLLRDKIRFRGMVVSDDLGAAVAVSGVPVGRRAVRFVRAGGDLVLTVRPQDAGPMTAALLAEARSTPAFAARVDDATKHVLRAKHAAGLLHC